MLVECTGTIDKKWGKYGYEEGVGEFDYLVIGKIYSAFLARCETTFIKKINNYETRASFLIHIDHIDRWIEYPSYLFIPKE